MSFLAAEKMQGLPCQILEDICGLPETEIIALKDLVAFVSFCFVPNEPL